MNPSSAKKSAEQKKAEKHRQILAAAIRTFSRYGYHSCTMNKVAQEAGVADGTLYLYVKSKDDLLIQAFCYVFEMMMERLDDELSRHDNPVDKLRRIMELHLEVMETDPDLAGFLQFQLRQPDPAIRQGITEPLTQYARRIEKVVDEGKQTGDFRTDVGTRAMRRVVFGALDETVSAWWFRRAGDPLTPKADDLFKTILHGVLA